MTAPVAIVIPVHDTGRLLTSALDSVARQTLPAREVIVVDDGSTDDETRRLLDDLERRPGIDVHRTPNAGPGAARNVAITHATAPLVLPLDADDHLHRTFLARTVPALDEHTDVDVVHTWVGLVGQHRGTWRTGPFTIPALLARCTVHITSLFRRTLWERVGGFDAAFRDGAEDWDFWLSAAGGGARAFGIPEVLTYYRRTPTSRERRARDPKISHRLMTQLVTKHRALYDAHLVEAFSGLYAEHASTAAALERVYQHPLLRIATDLRTWLGRR